MLVFIKYFVKDDKESTFSYLDLWWDWIGKRQAQGSDFQQRCFLKKTVNKIPTIEIRMSISTKNATAIVVEIFTTEQNDLENTFDS